MEWIHAAAEQIFLWLRELGYYGILFGLMIEIIPSEIVLSYGGFLVYQERITFVGAVIFGTIGGTLAQLFLYWIGKYGGRPFLDKYGKYLLIQKKHIDLSEQWFTRYGAGIIFTARFVPVVRHAISIPAGIVRMSFWQFTLLTTLAVIPWTVFFIYIGKTLGQNWQQIDEIASTYAIPFILIAVLLTILYFLYKMNRPKEADGAARKPAVNQGFQRIAAKDRKVNEWKLKVSEGHPDSSNSTTSSIFKKLQQDYHTFWRHWVQVGHSKQRFEFIVVAPQGLFHISSADQHTVQMYRRDYVLKELMRRHEQEVPVIGLLLKNDPGKGESHPLFRTVNPYELPGVIANYTGKRTLSQTEITQVAQLIEAHKKAN